MARKLSSYPLKNRIWAGVGMVITFVGAIALLGMYAHLGWWVTLGQAVAFILNVLLPISLVLLVVYLFWAWRVGKFTSLGWVDGTKRLCRSEADVRLFGVCGGFAQRYGLDSTVVRVVVLLLFFVSPLLMTLAYALFALLMPRE